MEGRQIMFNIQYLHSNLSEEACAWHVATNYGHWINCPAYLLALLRELNERQSQPQKPPSAKTLFDQNTSSKL